MLWCLCRARVGPRPLAPVGARLGRGLRAPCGALWCSSRRLGDFSEDLDAVDGGRGLALRDLAIVRVAVAEAGDPLPSIIRVTPHLGRSLGPLLGPLRGLAEVERRPEACPVEQVVEADIRAG